MSGSPGPLEHKKEMRPLANVEITSFLAGAREATGLVIVIDVFRAFTTAAVAFSRGARRIVLTDSPEAALELRDQGIGTFCFGERGGRKPDGFDFGNSPTEIAGAKVDDKILIQTTSNGTAGVLAAGGAEKIFAASLVCADATVEMVQRAAPAGITIVAMGRQGIRADEDEICALYLRSRLMGRWPDREALSRFAATTVPPPSSALVQSGNYGSRDREIALSVGTIPIALEVKRRDELLMLEPAHVKR